MIKVKTWPISQFREAHSNGTLNLSPDYQRRAVWNAKTQMLLIDSLAQQLPVGAITLYEEESKGFKIYDVIDGKQRLTALMNFLGDKLIVKANIVVGSDSEDDEPLGQTTGLAAAIYDRPYSDLPPAQRLKFVEYEFPVFVLSGTRADAVQAFTRMNTNIYPLTPQEIRNAMFVQSHFLNLVVDFVDSLSREHGVGEQGSYFVSLGIMTRAEWERMLDVQLASELLVLLMDGPQHRRDSLSQKYELYRAPGAALKKGLGQARSRLQSICDGLWSIFGGQPLQAYHFPRSSSNDFYALVGAFAKRGPLTQPQMKAHGSDVGEVISEFRRQANLYSEAVRDASEIEMAQFEGLVVDYASTFLGGQTNSLKRRETRIAIWEQVINDVVSPIDPNTFSPLQRQLVWSKTADKICARCGQQVEWKNYHAGHKKARALGGPSIVTNGQIEHQSCNQAAGPT